MSKNKTSCLTSATNTTLSISTFKPSVTVTKILIHSYMYLQEMEFGTKLSKLGNNYHSSMAEMKALLSRQKQLGDQCKNEMEILTKKFEEKTLDFKSKHADLKEENQDLKEENVNLREEIQKLRQELEYKSVEAHEAMELNGIYSAKLTKMQRKFKKLKDEDEESYMEMTF